MGKNRTGFIVKIAKKRTTLNWLFFILVLALGKGGLFHILAGIPFIFAGTLIRAAAAGTVKKNEELTTTGPYALCRHPLYFGSLLISAGLTVMSNNIFILVCFLVFFPLSYIPTMLMEEEFLAKKFGDKYLSYKNRVPAFIPAVKKPDMHQFSFSQMTKNSEHLNWAVLLILILAALIKTL